MAFPRRILLASDLNARSDRAQDRAAQLAGQFGATLVVLHVVEHGLMPEAPTWQNPREAEIDRRLRRDLGHPELSLETVVCEGRPGDTILDVAEAKDCGLIVTGVARNELLGRSVLGSTVERVATRSQVPVLAVKGRVRGPYERMVVATDFSDSSRYAFETAARYFPQLEPTLFHAFRVPYEGFTSRAGSGEWFEKEAQREQADFLARSDIAPPFRERLKTILEYGSVHELLDDYVQDAQMDVAVLGTHGRSGIFDIPLGNEALKLMATIPCDVMVAPEPRALPARRA